MKKGFTLIELSIALVIIGLIVGGVLVGQDLIKAAELRSITQDWNQFETARNTFRLKYNCLPGDCPNAATFGLGTNGDGDKLVAYNTTNEEHFYFWRHLATADLIEGSYTGLNGPGDNYEDAVIGTNVPASSKTGVGYSIMQRYPNAWYDGYGIADDVRTHFIITGKDNPPNDNMTFGGAFKPVEAMSLDTKIDDGAGNTGRVRTRDAIANHNTLGCTTGAIPNHDYDADNDSALCNIMYLLKP